MNQIKGIIFDMDGLIFDSERLYTQANMKTAQKLKMNCDEGYFEQFVGVGESNMAQMMLNDFDQEIIDKFFELGTQDLHELLLQGDVPMKEGVIPLLTYLEKHHILKMIASSSTTEVVNKMTENANIRHQFIEVVGGDQVEVSKPNPAIFLKALEKLKTPKHETLILEDSINGVRAAYEAGIPVIMVPDTIEATDECYNKAVAVKKDLFEVKKWIEKRV